MLIVQFYSLDRASYLVCLIVPLFPFLVPFHLTIPKSIYPLEGHRFT